VTPTAINAAYLDGQSAARHSVTVTIAPHGLAIHKPGGVMLWWPFETIRQTQGFHAGEVVHLQKDSESLIVEDPGFLPAIERVNPKARFGAPPASARRLAGKLAVLAAACVALLAVLAGWVMPAIGEAAASVVPVSFEEQLGLAVVTEMAPRRCREPALERIVEKLAANLEANPYRFRVYVADEREVNAFAAPGGYIIVFRGLLDRTRSPEEAAAVLAHEMQHVLQRHGTRSILRTLTFWALLAAVLGDASGVIVNLTGTLGELHFRRQDEDSADREALRVIERARIDPKGMVRMMRTLERESGDMPKLVRYLSTHPLPADRLRRIEEAAARARYASRPVLGGGPWPPPANGCRPAR